MYFKMTCPHCDRNLKVKDEYVGRRARCPYCKGSIEVVSPQPTGPPGDATKRPTKESTTQGARPSIYRQNTQSTKSDGTNVSLFLTAILGVGATVAFYLLLVFPLRNTNFGALFGHRGWVPYVIVLLAAWATSILFLKSMRLAKQRDSLLFDALPTELSHKIRPDNVDVFHRHICGLPCNFKHSFLLNRVFRALEHFKSRGSVQEVIDVLTSQAEIDASAVESSYTIIKVFIWAIPILGFIGTVIGISSAVSGFSTFLQDVEEIEFIRNSLGSVTSGLAVAFDTTLLALVMSLLIMFPTSSMQKAEEDLLISIGEYCNENLLVRLNGERLEKADLPEQIKKAVSVAMAEHDAGFRRWLSQLKAIGVTITQQVTEGWEAIHRRLQESHNSSLQQLEEVVSAVSEERKTFVGQVKAIQDAQVKQFSDAITSLGDKASHIQQQITALQDNQVLNFKDVVSGLSGDLKDLQQQAHERQQAQVDVLHVMAERFAEALHSLKEYAKAMHAETAKSLRDADSNQQETFHRLDEICVCLGEQAREVHKRMVELDTSRHTAAEQLLTKLASERSASTRATVDLIAKISKVEKELVSSLASCQQGLGKDIESFASVQQKIASNLEHLSKSDSFNMKLSRIEMELSHLFPVLSNLTHRIGSRHHKVVATAGQAHSLGRRIWQRIVKGDGNGST